MDEENKKQLVAKISPLMREILDKQKEKVKAVTDDVCDCSDYEASELLAKKIIDNKLLWIVTLSYI